MSDYECDEYGRAIDVNDRIEQLKGGGMDHNRAAIKARHEAQQRIVKGEAPPAQEPRSPWGNE